MYFLDWNLFSASAGVDGRLQFSRKRPLRGRQLVIYVGKLYPLFGSPLSENLTAHLSDIFSDHRYFAAHRIPHGISDRQG
jgi:hypothetical protein